jgi:hypothetical protein
MVKRISYVYWKDEFGGELETLATTAHSYGYSIGPHGEWEMVIAAEDKVVKKDESAIIKIEEIEVPPKSIAFHCPTMRHALGVAISVGAAGKPARAEERRYFNQAVFLPVCDGEVHKGEILSVLNILYATLERRLARGAAEKWLRERYRY